MSVNRVVVGVDGSPNSKAAVAQASHFASSRGMTLHVLHAFAPDLPMLGFGALSDRSVVTEHGQRLIDDGERRYSLEPVDDRTPEAVYEQRWALTLLERAVERLRDEQKRDPERIEALLPHVGGPGDARPYAELAKRLGSTPESLKVAVHRLRRRGARALARRGRARHRPPPCGRRRSHQHGTRHDGRIRRGARPGVR